MKSHILLVEDDPLIIKVLGEFIESAGHVVETAGDGDAGVRRAYLLDFDILIFGVALPGLSGPAICQEVRREGYHAAILMFTGV